MAASENPPEPLSNDLGTALIFAARYTHARPTSGAWVIIRALQQHWSQLDASTRKIILRESHGATCNCDDWQRLRDFATKYHST